MNQKYGCDINWENWAEHKDNTWQVYGIDPVAELPKMLDLLANSVVVAGSKYRVNVEQRMRKELTSQVFNGHHIEEQTIGHFVHVYSLVTWLLKEESNNFRAREVLGDFSPLEKDLYLKDKVVGVSDLERDLSVNHSMPNRFMRWLHSA